MLTETARIKQNRAETAKPSQFSRVFLEVPGGLRRDKGIQQAIIYEFNADKIICELVRLRKLHPDIVLPYITPHVFRHTFCTNLANAGMDVKNLQYLMGHSEVGVTLNVYTHANYDKAAEQLWKVVDFKSARRNAVSTPNLTPIGVKLA